jgi:hypothetical protein
MEDSVNSALYVVEIVGMGLRYFTMKGPDSGPLQ